RGPSRSCCCRRGRRPASGPRGRRRWSGKRAPTAPRALPTSRNRAQDHLPRAVEAERERVAGAAADEQDAAALGETQAVPAVDPRRGVEATLARGDDALAAVQVTREYHPVARRTRRGKVAGVVRTQQA